jgi:hypothetical protein
MKFSGSSWCLVVVVMVTMVLALPDRAVEAASTTTTPFSSSSSSTSDWGGWQPTRIALEDLRRQVPGTVDRLVAALQEVGLVSFSGINLPSWQGPFQECLTFMKTMSTSSSSSSLSSSSLSLSNVRNHIQSIALADGTTRTTLAVEGTQDLADIFSSSFITTSKEHSSSSSSSSLCQALEESGTVLRHRVDTVLSEIMAHLTEALGLEGVELLTTSSSEKSPTTKNHDQQPPPPQGMDLPEILKDALVLEHFHQYDVAAAAAAAAAPGDDYDDAAADSDNWALDWHVDQGLFLAFVPGSIAQQGQSSNNNNNNHHNNNKEADGEFHIQFQDGSTQRVKFDLNLDELVLMVGDAAEQIINPALRALSSSSPSKQHPKPLRALPHALTLRSSTATSAADAADAAATTATIGPRLWYGRMVLPPLSAHHPLSVSSSPSSNSPMITYGDLRQALMMSSSLSPEDKDSTTTARRRMMVLACSSPHHQHVETVGSSSSLLPLRFLADDKDINATSCNPDSQAFCWHQCMNYTDDANDSPESCTGRQLSLACANDDGYLWTTDVHDPQFYLTCVNKTTALNYTKIEDDGHSHSEGEGGDHDHGFEPPIATSSSSSSSSSTTALAWSSKGVANLRLLLPLLSLLVGMLHGW